MATTENFILRVKTEGTKAIQDLSHDVAQFGDELGILGNTLGNITGRLGVLGSTAAAVGTAFVALGVKAINTADAIQDMADATGISAGQLKNLKSSMIEAGGNADSFEKAAVRLAVAVGDAAAGSEKAGKAFQDLGVYTIDANGKVRDTGDILEDVIAALAKIEDPAVRAAKAYDLLGKEAAKIDFSKVKAGRDAVTDQQIAQLAKYKEEWDKLAVTLETKVLKFFGELAIQINQGNTSGVLARLTESTANLAGTILNLPTDAIRAGWNALVPDFLRIQGQAAGLGDPLLTMAKKAEAARRQIEGFDLGNLEANIGQTRSGQDPTQQMASKAAGRFRAVSEAEKKAAEESAKKIQQMQIETNKNTQITNYENAIALALQQADEITAIELNRARDVANINFELEANIDKAKADIRANDKLNAEQQSREIAAKELELRSKAASDIAKVVNRTNQDIAKKQLDDYVNLQKSIQEFNDEQEQGALKAVDDVAKQDAAASKLLEKYRELVDEADKRAVFEGTLVNLSDTEKKYRQELFDIETRRLQRIKEIMAIEGQSAALRDQRLSDVNALAEAERTSAEERRKTFLLEQEDFAKGWAEAYQKYQNSAKTAAQQAQSYFDTFTRGFEDAIVRFVQTGKLSFRDLANSIIAEFARAQANKMASSLLGFVTNLFTPNYAAELAGGLRPMAAGGSVDAGSNYLVGERGPELFVPKSAGTIVPNHMLGGAGGVTNVNYTIQAVDAQSFRSLVARDPQFIYQVTEAGRRSQPSRRLT